MDDKLISIAINSRERFFFFVKECNKLYRYGHDLDYYRKIISMHRSVDKFEDILNDDLFSLIYSTLEKWNMNMRGAKLTDIKDIKKTISKNKPMLIDLYQYKLHKIESLQNDEGEKILRRLRLVFKGLDIMKSKRRIVGVSKTMHFLLPDLVLPIDSEYTMNCIYGYNKYSDNIDIEANTFTDIFTKSYHITKSLNLNEHDVTGDKWNTSIPKLIDNAMIGLLRCIKEYGPEKSIQKIEGLK